MKIKKSKLNFVVLFVSVFLFNNLFAQGTDTTVIKEKVKKNCISIGFLQGGGALFGADYERLITDKIGLQIGTGLVGFGGAINYHPKPSINSSAISLCFWNQGGPGETLGQRLAGLTYILRSKKGLTVQVGFGYVMKLGQSMNDYYEEKNVDNPPSVILLYSVGYTFKF